MTRSKTLREMTNSDAYKARVLARKRCGGDMKRVLDFEAGYRAAKREKRTPT